MSGPAVPVAIALFVWWFSTGAIICLDNLPARTFRWSMLGITLLAGLAFHRMPSVADDLSVHGAYAGFVCALVIWGWQEMSFLMGVVTGPRKTACVPGCHGWVHFTHGVQVVIYHELAILAGFVAILLFSWGGANQVATETYAILWGMRVSAKLCLFLGVRNVTERFLPPHLAYLGSFFRRRRMNALLPLSVLIGCWFSVVLIRRVFAATGPGFEQVAACLLATMMVLGVVEHLALVAPVPFEALWNWYLRTRRPVPPTAVPACCPSHLPTKPYVPARVS